MKMFFMAIVLTSGFANASQNLSGAYRPALGNDPDQCFSEVEIRAGSNASLQLHFDTEYSNGGYHRTQFATCGAGAVHDIKLPAGTVVTKEDTPVLDYQGVSFHTSKSWNTTQLMENKFVLRYDFEAKTLFQRKIIDRHVSQLTGTIDPVTGTLTLNCYEYKFTKHSYYTKGPKEIRNSCRYEKVSQ